MDHYDYDVELPFSKTIINFRELNTREQLLVAKANVSFSNNKDSLYSYYKYTFDIFSNCVKQKEEFLKLNIVDYVLFLAKLRTISVGSTIDFILKGEEKSKTKIQVDLKRYLLSLYNAANYFVEDENREVKYEDFTVKLNWPDVTSIKTFTKLFDNNIPEYEIFDDSLCEYIDEITFKEFKMDFKVLVFEEKNRLLEKLPINIKLKMQEKIVNSCKQLFETDLFNISYFSDYKFNLYNLNFIEHIKMIFSYDLKSLYSEIFYLASNNLNPEYVMTISNSERKLYMTIINEQNQQREKTSEPVEPFMSQNNNGEMGYSEAIKSLAVEFGQDLSK